MVAKVHFAWRNTDDGHSTFGSGAGAGVDFVELNDGTNDVTIRVGIGSSLQQHPQALNAHGITNWGHTSSGGTTSNLTLTQAGGSGQARRADLAGNATSAGPFQINVQNGQWEIEYAAGGSTDGTADSFGIFDATLADLVAGVSGQFLACGNLNSAKAWANSTTYSATDFIVDPTGQVWDITAQTGATGAAPDVPPAGAAYNDTYVSGGVTMKYTGRKALAWGYTSVGGANLASHNSDGTTEVAAGSWPGTAKTVQITQGAITLVRLSSPKRERALTVKQIVTPLEDVTLYNRYGESQGQTITPYCAEVPDEYLYRISEANGPKVFSLLGTDAACFSIELLGSDYWLVSATAKADAGAGAGSLTIRQTDTPNSMTHDTVLSVTWLTSHGKPQSDGYYQWMPTDHYVNGRKVVMDVVDAESWATPDPSTATSVVSVTPANIVSTLGAIITTVMALPKASRTTKYRVELGAGTYSSLGTFSDCDFGDNGWLVLTAAAGASPVLSANITWCVRHLYVTNLLTHTVTGTGVYSYFIRSPSAGASGINGDGTGFAEAVIEWVGGAQYAGLSESDWAASSTDYNGLRVENAKFLKIKGGKFYRRSLGATFTGSRLVILEDCDFQQAKQDDWQARPSGYADLTGIFASNNCYLYIKNKVSRNEVDPVGYTSSIHIDDGQIVRQVSDAEWTALGDTPDENNLGDTRSSFVVPVTSHAWNDPSRPNMRVYKVFSGADTQTSFGGTEPISTDGLDEVNGDVTVRYLGVIKPSTLYIYMEGGASNADGPNHNDVQRQDFINSNTGRNQITSVCAFDRCVGIGAQNGMGIGSGYLRASRCTLAPHSTLGTGVRVGDQDDTPSLARLRALDNDCYIYGSRNVVSSAASMGSGVTSAKIFENPNTLVVPFTAANDPNLVLAGPFVQVDEPGHPNDNLWHYPQLDDSGTNSITAFSDELRSILAANSGDVGAFAPADSGGGGDGTVRLGRISLALGLGL